MLVPGEMSHSAFNVIDLILVAPENETIFTFFNGSIVIVLHNNMLPVQGQIDQASGQ